MKYNRLNLNIINNFISDKLTMELSEKYVSDMVIMIKSAAKWAEVNYNYANQIRNTEIPRSRAKETTVFTQEEQKLLLTALGRITI